MWAELEATTLASHLRASVWSYPLVSAGHILGLAMLVGAVVPLDLRLLGLWRSEEAAPLLRVCRAVSAAGLALAVSMGALLFAARATEYAVDPIFQAKLALLAVALLNAALAERALRLDRDGRLRLHAGLSLLLWPAVIVAGRAIAYF